MTKLSVVKSENLRITKPLFLRDFSKDFEDDYLSVWLNPDEQFWGDWFRLSELQGENEKAVKAMNEELALDDITQDRCAEITKDIENRTEEYLLKSFGLMARFWSCDAESVKTIQNFSNNLYKWCVTKSFELLAQYGSARKKG